MKKRSIIQATIFYFILSFSIILLIGTLSSCTKQTDIIPINENKICDTINYNKSCTYTYSFDYEVIDKSEDLKGYVTNYYMPEITIKKKCLIKNKNSFGYTEVDVYISAIVFKENYMDETQPYLFFSTDNLFINDVYGEEINISESEYKNRLNNNTCYFYNMKKNDSDPDWNYKNHIQYMYLIGYIINENGEFECCELASDLDNSADNYYDNYYYDLMYTYFNYDTNKLDINKIFNECKFAIINQY